MFVFDVFQVLGLHQLQLISAVLFVLLLQTVNTTLTIRSNDYRGHEWIERCTYLQFGVDHIEIVFFRILVQRFLLQFTDDIALGLIITEVETR